MQERLDKYSGGEISSQMAEAVLEDPVNTNKLIQEFEGLNIAEKSFEKLYSIGALRRDKRSIAIKYSGHFKNYNSNAKYNSRMIEFNLASRWEDVDEDIQIGVVQNLIIKIYKIKGVKTYNMELYESFMKNLSKYAKKHSYDPELEQSFDRVNARFFSGDMAKPNLLFANESLRKLGCYEYGSDTIHISTIFRGLADDDRVYLDYVMYHELLHKKHSFSSKNGRTQSHTKEFREEEALFGENMEEHLNSFLRRRSNALRLFKSRNKGSSQNPIKDFFKLW